MTQPVMNKKTAILEHFQDNWRPLFEECGCDFSGCNGRAQVLVAAPYRNDRNPSLTINLANGLWDDKANKLRGDPFHFWAISNDLNCETDFPVVLDGIIDHFGIYTTRHDGHQGERKHVKPLGERGITGKTALSFGLLEVPGNRRVDRCIEIPLKDANGNVIATKTHKSHTSPKGAEMPLFPSLKVVEQHDQLYVLNGELSVVRACQEGYRNVICGTVGETAMRDAWIPLLKDKDLCFVFDNDMAGLDGANLWCTKLRGIADTLLVCQWPKDWHEGGDAEDWINAGHRLEDLEFTEWRPPEETMEQPGQALVARRIADIEPMSVEWLWPLRVPIGHLTALEGDPGEGKSFVTQAITASISQGYGLPEGEREKPGNVLLFTAEDHLATTVRPRLESMGCDLERVFALDKVLSFNDEGLKDLEDLIRTNEARLVVIDPIVAFLAASVDMHRANEVRSVLSRLSRIAEGTASAIIIVRHLAKGSGTKVLYRGLGSIDFAAACRSVLLAGHAQDDANARALVHIKSNLGPLAGSIGYSISKGEFRWTGTSPLSAADLLAQEDTSRLREARDFLTEILAQGPRRAEEVKSAAKAEDISGATLRRAQKALGVKPSKQRNSNGSWYWQLPPEREEDAHDEHLENVGEGARKVL